MYKHVWHASFLNMLQELRMANMSWRACVTVKQIQSNPSYRNVEVFHFVSTVWCRNIINLLQNNHNRHPIARPSFVISKSDLCFAPVFLLMYEILWYIALLYNRTQLYSCFRVLILWKLVFINSSNNYTLQNKVVGGYIGFTLSIRLSVRPSLCPASAL